MTMNTVEKNDEIYHERDYRETIRAQLKKLQSSQPSFTLKKLASKIPIQYTYFSKAMNHPKVHLSEDHLFITCDLLQFLPEERDFILLKRAYDTASVADRKKYLIKCIQTAIKKRQLNAEVQNFSSKTDSQEMQYLFDPLCMVVHIALQIESIRKNPKILCEKLGIEQSDLKVILQKLVRNEIILLEEGSSFGVKKILKESVHFGQSHPYMRVHQNLMKSMTTPLLLRTSEEFKQSILVTFTMDQTSFLKVKLKFNEFLKEVELIARKARSTQVYQLQFDLFKLI